MHYGLCKHSQIVLVKKKAVCWPDGLEAAFALARKRGAPFGIITRGAKKKKIDKGYTLHDGNLLFTVSVDSCVCVTCFF